MHVYIFIYYRSIQVKKFINDSAKVKRWKSEKVTKWKGEKMKWWNMKSETETFGRVKQWKDTCHSVKRCQGAKVNRTMVKRWKKGVIKCVQLINYSFSHFHRFHIFTFSHLFVSPLHLDTFSHCDLILSLLHFFKGHCFTWHVRELEEFTQVK